MSATRNVVSLFKCYKYIGLSSGSRTGNYRGLQMTVSTCKNLLNGWFISPSLNKIELTQKNSFSMHEHVTAETKPVDALPQELDKLYRFVEVECRGAEPAVLKSYHKFVMSAASHLEIPIASVEFPRYHAHRMTLLKSVFIHKKHRVQYEIRTHFLIMKFQKLTSSTTDTFLEYIQRNLPEGVAMKVTTEELCQLPPHVKPSEKVHSNE